MTSDRPPEKLLALQQRFAGHLRDPDGVAAPEGLEERRLAIYRRLFFNNLNNLFARNFPVIRKLFDQTAWDAIIRDFMIVHRSTTPLFTEIGSEFVNYLQNTRKAEADDPPWLAELAHWEYLETCVRLAEADPQAVQVTTEPDLLEGIPVANPTLRMARYAWPVNRISPDYRPSQPEPEPLLLAVWRHRNDRVGFMKLNTLAAHLIDRIQSADGQTGRSLLETIAEQIAQPAPKVIAAGRDLLESLHQREVLLGSRAS
jgi:uncharacterized protein